MDKIVDHLFVFRGEGKIEDFPGNYSDFRAYEGIENTAVSSKKKPKTEWKNTADDSNENKASYEDQRILKKLEKEIASLESKKENLQNQFTDETLSPDEIKALSIELKTVEETLEEKTDEWLNRSI
jgi:ATP-binding cassette subfamily F protein uup